MASRSFIDGARGKTKAIINNLHGDELLSSPILPQWGCACGTEHRACRVGCRICRRDEPRRIVTRPQQASKSAAGGSGTQDGALVALPLVVLSLWRLLSNLMFRLDQKTHPW